RMFWESPHRRAFALPSKPFSLAFSAGMRFLPTHHHQPTTSALAPTKERRGSELSPITSELSQDFCPGSLSFKAHLFHGYLTMCFLHSPFFAQRSKRIAKAKVMYQPRGS